jgi:hypothetical protein
MTTQGYQFFYGPYTHPNAEVAFEGISRRIEWSPTQRANTLTEAWNMKGKFVYQGATAQSQILAALATTRTAYSRTDFAATGYSAGMLLNGAQTPFLLNAVGAIGGVVVTNPVSHGKIEGSEGCTYLHYKFGLRRESFLSTLNDLLDYKEQLSFSDCNGAPLQIWRMPLVGAPVVQSISTSSWFDCTQQGQLLSRNPNPQPEQPLFPNSIVGEPGSIQVSYFNPKMVRGTPVAYGVQWSYKFRQSVPFGGARPHARG